MDDLRRLMAIEAIKCLKARYFRAIDGKDLTLLEQVMAQDVVCDARGSTTDPATGINFVAAATQDVLIGRPAVVAAVRSGLADIVSVHQGSMPEIEILSESSARGRWCMVDRLQMPPGGPLRELIGYGHYDETYEYTGGDWRIKTLRLTRLRVDAVSSS